MAKGGYFMIDCGGLNLLGGSTPQTIPGLYERMQLALEEGKPVQAYNCIYGTGHPLTPVNVFVQQETEHMIIATASILQVRVTDDATGNVTITSLIV